MEGDPRERVDVSEQLSEALRAELAELLRIAEAVEPVMADLAERYDGLRRWDHAWPERADDPGTLDGDVLEAAGDNRVGALLGAVAARPLAALEGCETSGEQMRVYGLRGFGVEGYQSCAERRLDRAGDDHPDEAA
jgi:hypothetical protein